MADRHTEYFAPAVTVDTDGDDDGDRDDAAGPPNLYVGRVHPEVGPVAFDRAIEEGLHTYIDLLAQPADLTLRNAAHAHGFDQIVHRPGRYALNIGFLNNGGQCLLR